MPLRQKIMFILALGVALHGLPPASSRVFADCAPIGNAPLETVLLDLSARPVERLTGSPIDRAFVGGELDRIARRIREELAGRREPERAVAAMNAVVFGVEEFTYDCGASDPDLYLLDRILAKKRANCLGMTVLYVALAQRLDLPLRGVYVPSHAFARYDDGTTRINMEFSDFGAAWSDGRYGSRFRLSSGRPYLRSLDNREMAGVYLKTLGAACSRKGMTEEAAALYREAALLYPGLPDTYYNVGVLFMRTGRVAEAIAQYRQAVGLDPEMACARSNLAAALATRGLFEEALAEARRAVALEPRDTTARRNLAQIHLDLGNVREGVRELRNVLEIDPGDAKAVALLAEPRASERGIPGGAAQLP